MKPITKLACGLFLAAVTVASQAIPSVKVDIYSGTGASTGGGAPYSGFVGSFTSPDIMFATSTSYAWHPFGQASFGADITGRMFFPNNNGDGTGSGTFSLNSAAGSLLFIDGTLVIDNGGAHGPSTVLSSLITLPTGHHDFEVQFYAVAGGSSGVDLLLPAGFSYSENPNAATVPDGGSTMGLLGSAMLLICCGRKLNRAFSSVRGKVTSIASTTEPKIPEDVLKDIHWR